MKKKNVHHYRLKLKNLNAMECTPEIVENTTVELGRPIFRHAGSYPVVKAKYEPLRRI